MKASKKTVWLIVISSALAVLSIGVYIMSRLDVFSFLARPGSQDIYQSEGTLITELGEASSSTEPPADYLIANIYNSSEFQQMMGITLSGEMLHLSRIGKTLNEFHEFFPIECLRTLSDELVYAVYKLRNDDGITVNAYLFFEKISLEGGLEIWNSSCQMMMADRRLSYADFSAIKTGSALSDVLEITMVAELQKPKPIDPYMDEIYNALTDTIETVLVQPEPILEFKTCYYLDDGILRIVFSRKDENDDYMVKSVEFSENHDYVSSKGKTLLIQIWDSDYPIVMEG